MVENWKDTGLPLIKELKRYYEMLQGNCTSCGFLAAVISAAWTDETAGTSYLSFSSGTGKWGIQLYNANRSPFKNWVTSKLCLNAASQIQFAHSSDSGEIWPGIWEKAYAAYLLGLIGTTANPVDTFAWSSVPWSQNVKPLTDLTGKSYQIKPTSSYTATAIYNLIASRCSGGSGGGLTTPLIAWTAPTRPAGSPLSLSHNYAILGTLVNGSSRYIVLRDPVGGSDPAVPAQPSVTWKGINIGITSDGIFALSQDNFKAWYAGLAYY